MNITGLSDTFQAKLDELRSKIMRARHAAQGVSTYINLGIVTCFIFKLNKIYLKCF